MSYMTQNIYRQGHTWYVRYVVPTKWRKIVGKDSISRTLKTRDLDQARRRKHAKLDEIIREVEQLVASKLGGTEEAQEAAGVLLDEPREDLRDIYEGIIDDRAQDIADKGHEAEAQRYFDIATGKGVPISVVADQWLASLQGKVTPGTIDGRRHAVGLFIEAMGDLMMNKVRPRTASKWLSDHLEKSGRSPKTLGRYIGAMNLLWKWARQREYCQGISPFADLARELPKAAKKKRAFTDKELTIFYKALERRWNQSPKQYDVGLLLIESGCRLNEICELRVKDVQPNGEVHIRDAKTQAGNRVVFFPSERAQEVLNRRTGGKQPEDQLFEELRPGGQDHKLGHSLSKRMRATLAEALPNAKEQGLDLHSIRRWAGTVLENLEGIEPTLKERMIGHKTGKLLTDVYSSGPEKKRIKMGFEVYSKDVLRRVS